MSPIDLDLAGFADWLETHPYSDATRKTFVQRLATCAEYGVTDPAEVDAIPGITTKYKKSLRGALHLLDECKAASA
jgi:hypothetical protein